MATMTHLDNSVVPKWNEEPSTLDAFEERVILYVLGTKKEERYLCGEQDTVDGALGTYDEPWEDQSWEEPEEAEFPDDDRTDELPPDDPELEDQFGSLEAAEAYAVTEFKNASSDMKNATRPFMEAKDLVSRVKHAREVPSLWSEWVLSMVFKR